MRHRLLPTLVLTVWATAATAGDVDPGAVGTWRRDVNTFVATGKLGSGLWRRADTSTDPPGPPQPAVGGGGGPGPLTWP